MRVIFAGKLLRLYAEDGRRKAHKEKLYAVFYRKQLEKQKNVRAAR